MPQLEIVTFNDGATAIRAAGKGRSSVEPLGKPASERHQSDRTIRTYILTDHQLASLINALQLTQAESD